MYAQVTLFPCGGHRWIAKDYIGPDVEHDEVQEEMRRKRRAMLTRWPQLLRGTLRRRKNPPCTDNEASPEPEKSAIAELDNCNVRHRCCQGTKHVSFSDGATAVPTDGLNSQKFTPSPSEILGSPSRVASPTPTSNGMEMKAAALQLPCIELVDPQDVFPPSASPELNSKSSRKHFIYSEVRAFFRSLISPASISIFIAFPIALIPPLKALFVPVSGVNMPVAPDGQPPLAFIMDAATFIGAASVPLGLVCLGSALARLSIPRNNWSSLPLGAIASLAVGKLLVMPVLGVLISLGLVRAGLIDESNKVLLFTCMFVSFL